MTEYLILIHASLGGIALLSGLFALLLKKGSNGHKLSGKIFFWSMLLSVVISMIVANLPDHESPFLFSIGILSLYLIVSGYLALRYKRSEVNLTIDKTLSFIMLFTGFGMIFIPLILLQKINIVLAVFGVAGIFFAIQDFRSFKKPDQLKKKWLQAHLGKMIGGYIAAVTAFVVVNQFFPPLVGWLGPSIPGTILIIYWTRKMGSKKA